VLERSGHGGAESSGWNVTRGANTSPVEAGRRQTSESIFPLVALADSRAPREDQPSRMLQYRWWFLADYSFSLSQEGRFGSAVISVSFFFATMWVGALSYRWQVMSGRHQH